MLTCCCALACSRCCPCSQVLEGFVLTQENWSKLGLLIATKMQEAKNGAYNEQYNKKGAQLDKFVTSSWKP